jgi:hypothetical protein
MSIRDHAVQSASDIDELVGQVNELVASRQLVMIPALPLRGNDSGFVAFLGPEEMGASEFCDLAVAAGVKIFYVQASAFDAERDLTVSPGRAQAWLRGEENAGLVSLRTEASSYNGRTGEVELGFAAGGVLHCWIATAPWYDRFTERLEDLEPGINPMFDRMPEAEEQAMVDRLAGELIQMPEFRSAPTAAQRRRVARAQSEIASLDSDTRPPYRHVAYKSIHQAEEQIAAEADTKYREIEAKLADLAAECEATPAFRNAGSARARKEHARDFLAEKAGGYPPPTRLLELFLDTPPLRRTRAVRP